MGVSASEPVTTCLLSEQVRACACVRIGVQCKQSTQAIEWFDCVFREIGKIVFVELTDAEEYLD